MKWPEFNLASMIKGLESGSRPHGGASLESEGLPSLGAEHIGKDGQPYLKKTKYIPTKFYESLKQGKIFKNDILVVKDGATTGKVAFVDKSFPFEKAAVNEHVFIVRVNPNMLISKFAFYWLYSKNGKRQILIDFRGSAQGGITKDFVRFIKLPTPPLSEQIRIVEILDQADALRKKRAETDAKYERIITSLFYKMFGDPATNPMGWSTNRLACNGTLVRYGLGQPPQTTSSGVPLIRATNIKRGMIKEADMMFVKPEDIPESRNAFLSSNEVIVVRSGAYTGDVAQVKQKWEGAVAGYDLVVTPGDKTCGEFIETYLLTPYIQKNYFYNLKTRAGQPHLNATQLSDTPTLQPPKSLQIRFANYLKNIRLMTVNTASCKQILDHLYSVLLQNAFSSNLTAKWRKAHMKELLKEMEEQAKYLQEAKAS